MAGTPSNLHGMEGVEPILNTTWSKYVVGPVCKRLMVEHSVPIFIVEDGIFHGNTVLCVGNRGQVHHTSTMNLALCLVMADIFHVWIKVAKKAGKQCYP